jgi:hypothetical protein
MLLLVKKVHKKKSGNYDEPNQAGQTGEQGEPLEQTTVEEKYL